MNLSAWGIKRPLPTAFLFAFLTLGGLIGFQKLPITDLPDIELPTVTVTVQLAGASPAQLETDVTRKVENAVAGLTNVEHTRSTVTDGVSTTTIEFDIDMDVNVALDDVRDAVSRIRTDLPQDIDEPVVQKIVTAGRPIVTYAVESASLRAEELSWLVDDSVEKALMARPGVGKVMRRGGVDREVRIDLDPARLLSFGVTAAQVSQQLRRAQVEASGGRSTVGGQEQSIRTMGTVNTAAELAAFTITTSDGRRLRLDALGAVEDRYADPTEIALVNGNPVVAFDVLRARGSSEVSVAEETRKAVAALQAANPTVTFREVASSVPYIETSYQASMQMLWEGALLAVVVVWFFLRDWRATFVSAVALPLSVIPTFLVMQWLDLSLNTLTLLALSLVVGILVDDAIVEVENIVRHQQMGKAPKQAALDAADEIGVAVIATTLTLVAVFLPVAFMPGVPGKFFKQFGYTTVAAVLFSLLVARLLTPMMAAYWMKARPDKEHRDPKWLGTYVDWVKLTLRHRRATFILATLLFFGSVALVPLLPTGFLPASNQDFSQLSVELPPGARLEETQAVAEAARKALAPLPEVESIYTAIGTGGSAGLGETTSGTPRKATLTVNYKRAADRKYTQQELEAQARELVKGVAGARLTFGGGGHPGEKAQVVLASDDATQLYASAAAVERELRQYPGLGSVTSSANLLRPEIVVRPDPARAASLGVATQDIAEAARIATAGDVDFRLSKLNLPARQVPIRVQLASSSRDDLDTLRQLRVPTSRGGSVPLESVASLEYTSGPAQINRYDRYRQVTIDAELGGLPVGDVLADVKKFESMQQLPPSVRELEAGDGERMRELFTGFALAMVIGIFCVYAVLVLLFEDFLQPVTILAALPLSIGGAIGMLLVGGHSLSVPALIGILMLMGIVTKNSILLVDYAIIARRAGLSREDAMLDACAKRARPILMTTLAMGAGMLPIAMGLVGDSSFRAPMAFAVIGGLVTSTVLSLLVIPSIYLYVDDFEQWLVRFARRLRFSRAGDASAAVGEDSPSPVDTGGSGAATSAGDGSKPHPSVSRAA